jgi:hypothetical protein
MNLLTSAGWPLSGAVCPSVLRTESPKCRDQKDQRRRQAGRKWQNLGNYRDHTPQAEFVQSLRDVESDSILSRCASRTALISELTFLTSLSAVIASSDDDTW